MHEGHSHSAAHASAGRLRLVLLLTGVVGESFAQLPISFAHRTAATAKTSGYYRLEMLAALANGLLLIGVAIYILFETTTRISDPPDIPGETVLAVAVVGLLVNLVCAYLLFEGQKTSLNMRGAYLEVVSDFLGSVVVIIAAVVILTTGFLFIDPIASILIALFILPRTWKLISESVHVLLEGTPRNVD